MTFVEEDIDYRECGITKNHIKEVISSAYVRALTGYAGLNFAQHDKDYGMDGSFIGVKVRGNRRIVDGTVLDFQLKASENIEVKEDVVKYDLEVKNYHDLIETDVITPRILILYKFPKDIKEWINIDENNGTLFKDCAWWCSLNGLDQVNNNEKVRITIPRNQILNDKTLNDLMQKIRKGESLR